MKFENALDIFDLDRARVRRMKVIGDTVSLELGGFSLRGTAETVPSATLTFTSPVIDGYLVEKWDGRDGLGSWVRNTYTGIDALRRLRRSLKHSATVLALEDFSRGECFHLTADMSGNDPFFTLDLSFTSVTVEWDG